MTAFDPDWRHLDDLVTFARIEVESGDLEPWAALIRDLYDRRVLDLEQMHWVTSLYNTYDAMDSAWPVYRRWANPIEWWVAEDRNDAADYPCMTERRNLRGGRVLKRLDSYASLIAAYSGSQDQWLRAALENDDPEADYRRIMTRTRRIWGVGRQAAFEWAEFLEKVAGFPIHAPDAELWESQGPRRSLQRLYGNPNPDLKWLNDAADHARAHLLANGVDLPWEDFETVICDFNVMRDGRYYPGRHLAALRGEIDNLSVGDREELLTSWDRIVPGNWADIAPGINPDFMPLYRDTGQIRGHA